jgi:hypothetical protein
MSDEQPVANPDFPVWPASEFHLKKLKIIFPEYFKATDTCYSH